MVIRFLTSDTKGITDTRVLTTESRDMDTRGLITESRGMDPRDCSLVATFLDSRVSLLEFLGTETQDMAFTEFDKLLFQDIVMRPFFKVQQCF